MLFRKHTGIGWKAERLRESGLLGSFWRQGESSRNLGPTFQPIPVQSHMTTSCDLWLKHTTSGRRSPAATVPHWASRRIAARPFINVAQTYIVKLTLSWLFWSKEFVSARMERDLKILNKRRRQWGYCRRDASFTQCGSDLVTQGRVKNREMSLYDFPA